MAKRRGKVTSPLSSRDTGECFRVFNVRCCTGRRCPVVEQISCKVLSKRLGGSPPRSFRPSAMGECHCPLVLLAVHVPLAGGLPPLCGQSPRSDADVSRHQAGASMRQTRPIRGESAMRISRPVTRKRTLTGAAANGADEFPPIYRCLTPLRVPRDRCPRIVAFFARPVYSRTTGRTEVSFKVNEPRDIWHRYC